MDIQSLEMVKHLVAIMISIGMIEFDCIEN